MSDNQEAIGDTMSQPTAEQTVENSGDPNVLADANIRNEDENDRNSKCGVGRFHPTVLRKCANIPMFTCFNSISSLVTSTLTSYVNSQATTLERHYGFTSQQIGLIMASNDLGLVIAIIFTSILADYVHIPRALGFFTAMFGLSGVLCALPYFLYGAPFPTAPSRHGIVTNVTSSDYGPASWDFQLCDGVRRKVTCIADETSSSSLQLTNLAWSNHVTVLAIIMVGMILQGVAKSPRVFFSTSYVDNNVEKMHTGFYLGIVLAASVLAPALAFGLGGVMDRIYVTLDDTNITVNHQRWIGAWWLGFVIFGCAALLCSVPLFFFPRHLEGRNERRITAVQATIQSNVIVLRATLSLAKQFPRSLIRLCTNPLYVCTVLSFCCIIFAASGNQAFTVKYIENQFSFPTWLANMSMAAAMLITACIGTFVGGYLTRKLKMRPTDSMKFILVVMTIGITTNGLSLIFKCKQPYIYNSPGPRASEQTTLPGCLQNCACDDNAYYPVCAKDGRTFFSPCHAGCQDSVNETYINCTCIEEGTAVEGMCDYSCVMFYPFITALSCTTLTVSLALIPKMIVFIRTVEKRDRPLAFSLSSFMMSTLGWIPAVIVFGKLIDSSCIQWTNPGCGPEDRGACLLYDNNMFRWKLIGIQTISIVVGQVFMFTAYVLATVFRKFRRVRVHN